MNGSPQTTDCNKKISSSSERIAFSLRVRQLGSACDSVSGAAARHAGGVGDPYERKPVEC
jgi:hypothetical protein